MKHPKFNLNDLSVIVPIGEGDQSWKTLASELVSLPLGTEILFVGTRFKPSAMSVLSESQALGLKVRWVTAKKGRASQMNAGAQKASKSFLWFLHADSLLEHSTLIALENSLIAEPDSLHFFQLRFSESLHGLMKLNEWGVKFRSQVFKMPFGDQGFVVSKAIFNQLGGYQLDAPYGEDHLFIWKARQAGVRLVAVQGFIKTSARKYQNRGWLKTTLLHQWLTYKQAIPEWLKWIKIVKCLAIVFCVMGTAHAQESFVSRRVLIGTEIAIGVPLKDVEDGYAIAHALAFYSEFQFDTARFAVAKAAKQRAGRFYFVRKKSRLILDAFRHQASNLEQSFRKADSYGSKATEWAFRFFNSILVWSERTFNRGLW